MFSMELKTYRIDSLSRVHLVVDGNYCPEEKGALGLRVQALGQVQDRVPVEEVEGADQEAVPHCWHYWPVF